MSFVAAFNALPLESLLVRANGATPADVTRALGRERLSRGDFADLLSPEAGAHAQ